MTHSFRRYERFLLGDLDRAEVVINQTRFKLFNISYKGFGFILEPYKEYDFPLNQEIRADLYLKDEVIAVSVNVVFKRDRIAGAKINPLDNKEIRKIIRFVTPKDLGASLKEIDPNFVRQTDTHKTLRWYFGKNNTEILIWRNERQELVEFMMIFFVYAVSGNILKETLLTANVNPLPLGAIALDEPWPEDFAEWNDRPDREVLQLAVEILSSASTLAPEDQEELSVWILK